VTTNLDAALESVIRSVWPDSEPYSVIPLEGGITNRNFRVDVAGESFVVRLAGKDTQLLGIDRDAEHLAATAAASARVAPEVVAFLPQRGALVTRFVDGDPLPPEDLERRDVLGRVVASVRAIHAMGPLPSTFDVFRVVEEYREVAASRGVPIPWAYDVAYDRAVAIERAFAATPVPATSCHNDLLNANFIVQEDRVLIVDYEYAGMGDLFFDLGNFSINNGISEDAQRMLLELYFGGITPANEARLKLMRIMSDFREAMWGVVQQGVSTLDVDYVEYADRHFTRCLRNADDERFESWLADATGEV